MSRSLENAGEKALSDPLLVEEIEARLCRVAEDGKSRQMASGKAKGKCLEREKNVAQNQTAEDFSPLFELLRQLPVRTWNPEQFYRDSERIYYLRQRWQATIHAILSRSAVCVPDFCSEN